MTHSQFIYLNVKIERIKVGIMAVVIFKVILILDVHVNPIHAQKMVARGSAPKETHVVVILCLFGNTTRVKQFQDRTVKRTAHEEVHKI